ncbi:MAG: hypothetical protein K0S12_1736 [Bacteroidetes bacterium]|nr:hypothetical protein [Bacteroidota bacterium]
MKRVFTLLFSFAGFLSFSQSDSLRQHKQNAWYFSFIYENDLFGKTDRYYTQGVRAQLVGPAFKASPLSKILFRKKNWLTYYGLGAEQDCFTPTSILYDTINSKERPYAGTFVLSSFATSMREGLRINSAVDLGWTGPCARCEEEQKAIHMATNNDEPLGWKNQIGSDVIINYKASVEQGLVNTNFFQMIGGPEIRLGTLYTDAGYSLGIRVGQMSSYFKNYTVEKNSTEKKFQCFITAKAKERYVLYNATLQGGLFSESPHVKKSAEVTPFVFTSHLGLTLAYKQVFVEVAGIYTSKEFKEGLDHGWGKCHLTFCF